MKLPPIIGILGCDILVPQEAKINLKSKKMTLTKIKP
jgi:hypothetical protein